MTARLLLPTQPITAKGDLPSRDLVEIIQRLVAVAGSGGGGATLADGDYGDVTVSGTGTVITIDAGAVGITKLGASVTLDAIANPLPYMDYAPQQDLEVVNDKRTSDLGSPVSEQISRRTAL